MGKPRPTRAMREFAARFAGVGQLGLALHAAGVVLGNLWLFHLFAQGALTVAGYVALLLVETLGLTLLQELQRARVPPAHRSEREGAQSPAGFLFGFLAASLVFAAVYGFWIWFAKDVATLRALLGSLQAWHARGLDLALALTGSFALLAAVADQRHYRRHGPPLVSSLELEATSRRILFAYGAIPIALPMLAALGGSIWLSRWAVKRWPSKHGALYGGLFVVGAWFGSFFLVAHAVRHWTLGLAFAFLLGKTVVELFFALMPFVVRRVSGPTLGQAAADLAPPVAPRRRGGQRRRRR